MHIVDHLLWIVKFFIEEFHGIPEVVVAPITPVLDNAIERHAQIAIFADNTNGFILSFVALPALPVTISPQGKHGHLPGKFAHLGNYPVGIFAIHKIIVDAIANLRAKFRLLLVVAKGSWLIIIPEQAITFSRLEKRNKILCVILNHVYFEVALNHFAVLQNP